MSDTFEVDVHREDGYRFEVSFPGTNHDALTVDEPEPLGEDAGPNAARLLGAAVGNCLAASLVFCLRKSDVVLEDVRGHVTGHLVRNDDGRLRIGGLEVELDVDTSSDPDLLHDCLQVFEDYCVVTASVREGVEVDVRVNVDGRPRPTRSIKASVD